MIRSEEIADGDSCLNNAADDEPLFVLRANDPLAPVVVSYWSKLAYETGLHEIGKAAKAASVPGEMREWRANHG